MTVEAAVTRQILMSVRGIEFRRPRCMHPAHNFPISGDDPLSSQHNFNDD